MEPKPENLYKLSKERKAVRSAIENGMPVANQERFQKEFEAIDAQIKSWHIVDESGLPVAKGGLSAAKERLRTERVEYDKIEAKSLIDEEEVVADISEYSRIKTLTESYSQLKDFEMRLQLEMKSHPSGRDPFQRLFAKARHDRREIKTEIDELEKEKPQAVRATKLVEYKISIHREGHIALTDSVSRDLDQIGQRLFVGKPIFLHGPTGTGKTSLARLAAKRFTGKTAEMVYCNPQTRESSVWGKTGLRVKEGTSAPETVDIYGPLTKAMAEGKVVIFDEFTALPQEQQVFIKGIFNAKPGDEVNIVGNGQVKMKLGFQMIFTANLKSEKNKERQELPPEIAREFEQNNIKINYLSEPESYDVMLARLMDKDGSITASWHDLNQTLPQFCSAMAEIQTAYTGALHTDVARATGNLNASGGTPGLKKFVLTQGTVEAIF